MYRGTLLLLCLSSCASRCLLAGGRYLLCSPPMQQLAMCSGQINNSGIRVQLVIAVTVQVPALTVCVLLLMCGCRAQPVRTGTQRRAVPRLHIPGCQDV
jgi:hypothetical protein